MKTLIIYKSVHHGNTKKIVKVRANALEAELLDLKDVNTDIIKEYDLIGFCSGIYYSRPHKKLIEFIDNLDPVEGRKAFVFSTSERGKTLKIFNLGHVKIPRIFTVMEICSVNIENRRFSSVELNDLLRDKLSKKYFEIIGSLVAKVLIQWGHSSLLAV